MLQHPSLLAIPWKILNAITEKALASFQYVADQPALISTAIQRSLNNIITTPIAIPWKILNAITEKALAFSNT